MSLRNQLAIFSITLMSLLTIPTRAENDITPVSPRIENTEFVVDVTLPEGWAVTDEFKAIPATIEFGGSTFHTLKFSNEIPSHGCVALFTSESDDFNEDVSLAEALSEAYQLAFPGSVPTSFTPSKLNIEGSVKADSVTKLAKISIGGSLEGVVETESKSTSIVANGNIEVNPDSHFAMVTGKITSGDVSGFGTIGLFLEDDYELMIAAWGADEETLKNDVIAFSKALKVTSKKGKEVGEIAQVTAATTKEEVAAHEAKATVDPANSTIEVQS